MVVQKNVELSTHTTIKIGGKAKYFTTVKSIKALKKALLFSKSKKLPYFIISGGSNTIFSDKGYSGLVIKIKNQGIRIIKRTKQAVIIKALAGTNWDAFVEYCVRSGYQGIECLSGIPGSVGATPIQNVGAYGQEVAQTIQRVECIDKDSLEKIILSNKDCHFSYRSSFFKGAPHLVITSIVFKLIKSPYGKTNYPQLSQIIVSATPTLQEIRSAVIKLRKEKSMVLSTNDVNTKSVGSFFKNPIINERSFTVLKIKQSNIQFWKVNSSYKISAAWLIESAGFNKGYNYNKRIGLSTKHALAIVNKNQATSADLVKFVKLIQKRVYEKFTVKLTPEPALVGIIL